MLRGPGANRIATRAGSNLTDRRTDGLQRLHFRGSILFNCAVAMVRNPACGEPWQPLAFPHERVLGS
jgi:hypothetical protein